MSEERVERVGVRHRGAVLLGLLHLGVVLALLVRLLAFGSHESTTGATRTSPYALVSMLIFCALAAATLVFLARGRRLAAGLSLAAFLWFAFVNLTSAGWLMLLWAAPPGLAALLLPGRPAAPAPPPAES